MTFDTTGSLEVTSSSSKKTVTLAYFAAFIGLGSLTAILGPSLPYLAENTHSRLSEIGFLFTARSFGYLLGSLRLGRTYDRLPGHAVFVSVLMVMAVMTSLAPIIPTLWLLTLVMFVMGIGEGALDIGTNLLLVWVHHEHASPYLNALHFFFGLGAACGPILVAQTILHSGGISWAFWGLALYLIPLTIWLLRLHSPTPPTQSEAERQVEARVGPIVLISLFFFLYVGAEASFGGWVFTYTTAQGLGDVASAGYLTSAFWGALTVGRLLGIPIAARLSPQKIIFTDLFGCLTSLALILAFPAAYLAVWVGAIGLGLSMASIFPTMLAFAERRMKMSGEITRWFFVGTGAGGMVLPWLSGLLFEGLGPRSTMAAIWLDMLLAVFVLWLSSRMAIPERSSTKQAVPELVP
jgi:FHS family Na+ dependent glucose MFS transporter 1